jgi:type III restriction enzyme
MKDSKQTYFRDMIEPFTILEPHKRRPSQTYLVNKLRKAVYEWRKEGYPGVTPTTKRLFQYWFKDDYVINDELFHFWFCQREAIETLVYVYEVMKKRNFIDLAREFGGGPMMGYDPSYDQYPLYAFKMATGSGKTFVMAMTITWSYLNWLKENKDDYTSKFLIIAGEKNIIYERIARDFKDGKIFKKWKFIPPEWEEDFSIKVILKEEPIHTIPDGVIFLTNVQQLQERKRNKEEVEEYVDDVLALEKVKKHDIYQEDRIKEVLSSCPNIIILKDEAHHIYSFEKEWKKMLLNLHAELVKQYGTGFNMELDFTATPKTAKGAFFPWCIVDFPLKEAIEMNIVKRPLKGNVKGAEEIASDKAHERYRGWIDAGIRRWREYKKALEPLGKRPILFIQCPKNAEADEVYGYVNTEPDLKDRVLLIHTDSTGNVLKKDLDPARKAARMIDEPEKIAQDPELKKLFPYGIDAIISTMMLNEGWDVNNVNVIVGLRSYGSARKVLPEQVIGRGLRKMFPDEYANPEKHVNILEIIGPPGLIDILEDLKTQEGIEIAEFDIEDPPEITTIFVDEDKLDKDIEIPILSQRIIIREFSIDQSLIDSLPSLNIPLENKVLDMEYVATDMLKGMEVIHKKWDLPVPKDPKAVISYYTDKILKQLKLTGAFATFYPIVKRYVEEKLFTQKIDLNNLQDSYRVLYQISSPEIQQKLISLFVEAFREMTFTEREPEKEDVINLSATPPFVWSKQVYPATKTIFNYVPCDNDFEVEISRFFERASDVEAFSKIVPKMKFFMEYRDSGNNLRLYYPDFVVKSASGEHYIIETKGRVDVDVEFKDNRAKQLCKDINRITGSHWAFIRIDQKEYEKYRFNSLKELINTLPKAEEERRSP